jgi:hypothetical protein
MIAEAGAGWTTFAMWHLFAHGLLRLAQFLRAPSWLDDANARRSALGGGAFRSGFYFERHLPARLREILYAAALSRFGIDAFIDRLVVRPLSAVAHLVSKPRPRLRPSDGGRIAERAIPLQGAMRPTPIRRPTSRARGGR